MIKKQYGLPYLGSKNKIAKWVIDQLPSAPVLVDMFCGGCSITHCAAESGKYQTVIANDIIAELPKLFVNVLNGKITRAELFKTVTREEFHMLKHSDILTALTWSFGNDCESYLYGSGFIEECKIAAHKMIAEDDIEKRYILYRAFINTLSKYQEEIKKLKDVESIKRLLRVQSVDNVQRITTLERAYRIENITSKKRAEIVPSSVDYESFNIPEDAVVYCDIPYINTDCKNYNGFDHERFYSWAVKQKNIYISEYSMPDDFVCIAQKKKMCENGVAGGTQIRTEKIFIPRCNA